MAGKDGEMRKAVHVKIFLDCCRLMLFSIIAGAVLITCANYFPIHAGNRSKSLEQLAGEQYFVEVPSTSGVYGGFHSQKPTTLELATDNLMVKMALYDGEGSGIKQAFRCYTTQLDHEYSRYWHGYVVPLRALLYFFDYYEIRILNGLCQISLFCAAVYLLRKRRGKRYAVALATSYMLLMPAALAQCLQYSWVFYVSFTALLLYLRHKEYFESGGRNIYFFLMIGVAAAYLDLLTYPLFTWGFLIVWQLLLQDETRSVGENLKKVVVSAISWVAGYAVMWAGKWAVGSLVLRENLFQKAVSEAMMWTVDGMEAAVTWKDRFHAIFLNWETYAYKLYFIVLAAWLAYAVVRSFWGMKKDTRVPALFLAGLSCPVWYMTLAAHTIMHHIFTHRIFGVAVAAFIGIILLSAEGKPAALSVKTISRNGIVLCLAGAVSLIAMFQLRFDYTVKNYVGIEFEETVADGVISMDFTPQFSEITSLGIGISTEGGAKGGYRVSLSDGEHIKYEDTIPAADWAEGNLHPLSVQMDLTADKTYTLRIEPQQTEGATYLWVTKNGTRPLNEIGSARIGERSLDGQMLTDITYWCRPIGKYNCLFWAMTLMYVCAAVAAAVWNCVSLRPKVYRQENM